MAYYDDEIWEDRPVPLGYACAMTTVELPPDRRILVTGSRSWRGEWYVHEVLGKLRTEFPGVGITLVHGGAAGVDAMAERAARKYGWLIEVHRADWRAHGMRAGLLRNHDMVQAGADLCLAFIHNHSKGATHCARLAEAAHIPVRYYRWEELCQYQNG